MQCLMACGVVPLRQQHDQIWVEALILESVDALDDLLLLEVDDRDRAVAHVRQAEEIVLHEGVLPVLGERHMVVATAPSPGSKTPSLPVGVAISRWFSCIDVALTCFPLEVRHPVLVYPAARQRLGSRARRSPLWPPEYAGTPR